MVVCRADGTNTVAEIKEWDLSRRRRTRRAIVDISTSALIKPNRERQRNAVRNDGNVAPPRDGDLPGFGRVELAILIHVGHQCKRRGINGNARHIRTDRRVTLDRVKSRTLEANFKFPGNISPVEIITSPAKTGHSKCRKYPDRDQHDQHFDHRRTAFRITTNYFHCLFRSWIRCKWKGVPRVQVNCGHLFYTIESQTPSIVVLLCLTTKRVLPHMVKSAIERSFPVI